MARPNSGEQPLTSPLSPYHAPSGGLQPPPAGPYGPAASPYAAGPASAAAKAGPTPAGLINALKRRWVLATFIGGLVAAVAAMAVWAAMPSGKHTARAVVQLRSKGSPEIVRPSGDEFESFRKSQMFLLKTRDLISRTLAEPSIASLEMVKSTDDPVRFLEEGIKIESTISPDILTINLSGDNPEDLRTVVDMLVRKYIDDATLFERKDRDDQLRKLEVWENKFKKEIELEEGQIRLMAQANQTPGGEAAQAKAARMQQSLAKLDSEVFAYQKEVQELEVNIELLQKKLEAVKADPRRLDLNQLELTHLVDTDPRLSELIRSRFAKESLLAREKKVGGESAPPIVSLKEEIERLDKDIAQIRKLVEPEVRAFMERVSEQQIKNKQADLKDKLNATRALLGARQFERDKFQKDISFTVAGDFDINSRLKELEPKREYLHKIQAQLAQVRTEKDKDPRVSIRESATVIMNQNLKQKTMISVAAAFISFFGVLVLIGFLEWRTRRIDGVDQVVTELGMRVIGTVPAFPTKASLKATDAAGNANWRFVLNESINSTRTMLLHSARSHSMQVVMVTSAMQGEGKTSLASQLASSMATAGMRTLIVDCDLRNPSIHKLFDLNLSAGVSEVLCQEADVSDAVQPTAVPNLWVIPAGQCSNRVITALAQGHPLETMFNRLRGQFDFIIVDSCPVLPVADALLIGQHVDGVVFSIMQDISQLPKVLVASERLQQLNVPLLGAVVNGVRAGSAYYAYGYNYVKQLPA